MYARAFAAILLLGIAAQAVTKDFLFPLQLENAQIQSVFIGCQEQATDGYDPKIDEPSPPPGMQTGYAGFIGQLQNSLLRKDVKAHGDLKQWRLNVQVYEGKPFRIVWNQDLLPKFYTLTLLASGKEVDMGTTSRFELTASEPVAFVAIFDADAFAAAQADEATAEKEPKEPAASTAESSPAPETAADPASVDSKVVAGGVSMLVVAMGALLLLIVIFAAVRR
jgi:hypothetical protein